MTLPNNSLAIDQLTKQIYSSPTPYHAVSEATKALIAAGFNEVLEAEQFPTSPGSYFLTRGGSLISWIQPEQFAGFVIVGAHTDSPNLRIRNQPDIKSADINQLGIEIYGGVLLNSWLDRDLGIAGRVQVRNRSGELSEKLLADYRPVLRVPQLAIHLDREIRKNGVLLDPQQHMTPMWALDSTINFSSYVADQLEVGSEQILSWDLMAFDTQPPTTAGLHNDLFISARIDNLYSAFAGIQTLIELQTPVDPTNTTPQPPIPNQQPTSSKIPVLCLFDHEEVGSTSASGANSIFLASILERISASTGTPKTKFLAGLSQSFLISTDGAHATHPNYPHRHDPTHQVRLNQGVVIKRNANQRYATDAKTEAQIINACHLAGIPFQFYSHRNDIPCGSTIGPAAAAQLGVSTVDVGAPQLAMHSIRETAGTADFDHLRRLLRHCWLHL